MKKYLYRFKTKEEFKNEFGENWRRVVRYSWTVQMDEMFGKTYPNNVSDFDLRMNNLPSYRGWSISHDMLIEKKPTKPSYKPKVFDKSI